MTTPTKETERLDALIADVERWRKELDRCERTAGELLDGEEAAVKASHQVGAARMLLDAAKDRYIAEAEKVRTSKCSIHGPKALIVSCPECVRAWGYKPGRAA